MTEKTTLFYIEEHELSKDVILNAVLNVKGFFSFDANYGADADGRRGVPLTTLEDWSFTIEELKIELSQEVAKFPVEVVSNINTILTELLVEKVEDLTWDD